MFCSMIKHFFLNKNIVHTVLYLKLKFHNYKSYKNPKTEFIMFIYNLIYDLNIFVQVRYL